MDVYILRRRNSVSKWLSYAAVGNFCVRHTVLDSAYHISCIQQSNYTDAPNVSNTSASNAYARNVAKQGAMETDRLRQCNYRTAGRVWQRM